MEMDGFQKSVTALELLINLRAAEYDIAPAVLSWDYEDHDFYLMTNQRYPYTLMEVTSRYLSSVIPKIEVLIRRLHDLGIVHSDLSPRNIVVSATGDDVRLIDYDRSYWLSDFADSDLLRNYARNYYSQYLRRIGLNNIQASDVIDAELDHWRQLAAQYGV